MKQMSLDIAHSFCTYLHFSIICSIELYLKLKSSIFQLENERKSKNINIYCVSGDHPLHVAVRLLREDVVFLCLVENDQSVSDLKFFFLHIFFSFSHLFLPFSNKLVEFDWFVILWKCFFFSMISLIIAYHFLLSKCLQKSFFLSFKMCADFICHLQSHNGLVLTAVSSR